MTRHQRLWIDGKETTRLCVDCNELKTAEFFMVPASEFGMGHGRVTICAECYDGPAKESSYEETISALDKTIAETEEKLNGYERDA